MSLTDGDKKYLEKTFATKAYAEETFAKKDEFLELKSSLEEVKEIVQRIDRRDKEDSNMFSGIFLNHDQRISRLEQLAKRT